MAVSSNNHKLAAIRGFLLDMDGTVFLSDQLLPGAKTFLDLTSRTDTPVLLLTNNSSNNREAYVHKIAAMGLQLSPEQILTSGEATAQYMQTHAKDARIALFGTPELEQDFLRYDLVLEMQNPDYVVLGFDTTIDYNKLTLLCDLVRQGLPYIATHPDFNCPIMGGFIPDIGAIMALVEASTGRSADIIIGKPSRQILDLAASRLGMAIESLCMVGDRLYTDIAMGKEAPIQTALVLSGETKAKDVPNSPFKPDHIFQNLGELAEALI
jgi:HAD superfamily hydrolase (TIGR01450 family)